ncbi:hypothetical protein E2C01_092303 [Portunus trituberculatus]|uniref:Uncharacterized protein n=1 Tax=Portunus trituberculatus TaxID=210409 RepID=A0A5B7JR09_PORTR|nr:hypothetical protein [Portunus trituberculatus]
MVSQSRHIVPPRTPDEFSVVSAWWMSLATTTIAKSKPHKEQYPATLPHHTIAFQRL